MRIEDAGNVGVVGGVDGLPSARPQLVVEQRVIDAEAKLIRSIVGVGVNPSRVIGFPTGGNAPSFATNACCPSG